MSASCISSSNEVIKVLKDSGVQLSNENWQILAKNLNVTDTVIETHQREQAMFMSSYWDPLEECIDWWIRNVRDPSFNDLVHALNDIDKKATASIQQEKLGVKNFKSTGSSGSWSSYHKLILFTLSVIIVLLILANAWKHSSSSVYYLLGLLLLFCIITSVLVFKDTSNKVHQQVVSLETKHEIKPFTNETDSKIDSTSLSQSQEKPNLDDRILESGDSGREVVEKCIEKLVEANVLTEDINEEFMRRLACVMSRYGEPSFKLEIDGGIWQVSKHAFLITQEEQYTLPERRKKCEELLRVKEWRRVSKIKLEKPLYSAVAAFLYLSTIGKPVPPSSDVLGQQDYWWNYYMDKHEAKRFMECNDYKMAVKTL